MIFSSEIRCQIIKPVTTYVTLTVFSGLWTLSNSICSLFFWINQFCCCWQLLEYFYEDGSRIFCSAFAFTHEVIFGCIAGQWIYSLCTSIGKWVSGFSTWNKNMMAKYTYPYIFTLLINSKMKIITQHMQHAKFKCEHASMQTRMHKIKLLLDLMH